MTLTQAKRAFRLFQHRNTSKATIRYNVTQYLRALQTLGDKWLLAQPVQRRTQFKGT